MRTRRAHFALLVATPALLLATATMATEPVSPAPAANAAGENPIVCKRVAVTGSRVKKEKICRTQREWETHTQRAQEYMRSIERGGSRQPGGEGLPTGG